MTIELALRIRVRIPFPDWTTNPTQDEPDGAMGDLVQSLGEDYAKADATKRIGGFSAPLLQKIIDGFLVLHSQAISLQEDVRLNRLGCPSVKILIEWLPGLNPVSARFPREDLRIAGHRRFEQCPALAIRLSSDNPNIHVLRRNNRALIFSKGHQVVPRAPCKHENQNENPGCQTPHHRGEP